MVWERLLGRPAERHAFAVPSPTWGGCSSPLCRHDNTVPPLPLKKKKQNKTKHEAQPGFLKDLSHRASPQYMIRNNDNIKKNGSIEIGIMSVCVRLCDSHCPMPY